MKQTAEQKAAIALGHTCPFCTGKCTHDDYKAIGCPFAYRETVARLTIGLFFKRVARKMALPVPASPLHWVGVSSDPSPLGGFLSLCENHVTQINEWHRLVGLPFFKYVSPVDVRACVKCQMCESRPSYHGCFNEECKMPLHPRWPAVYCSNNCALGDA